MLKKLSFFFLLLCFFFMPFYGLSQKLDYGVKYEGIGDNREFFSPYHTAETIFGSRLSGTAGFTTDSIHKFRTGFSYFYEYGSEFLELKPHLIMYYAFQEKAFTFKMGAFPMKETYKFPAALVSGKYEYYNPIVDGLFLQYKNEQMKYGLIVDWVGRQDVVRREQFWAGFFGKYTLNNFFVEEYAYMFHNAHRKVRLPGENIEDYIGTMFMVGYDFSDLVSVDVLTVKTGTLSSAYRNRGMGADFNIKTSSYTEIKADYKGYGIEANLKFGHQHQIIFGNAFYRNAKNYIRTKFYFTPFQYKNIRGQFSWSFHIANGDLDQQQQFRLVYLINNI